MDVFNEKDHILLIAELPGVEEKDIKLEIEGDILKLTANSTSSKYAKEILLPDKVKVEMKKTVCKNGILEIILPKG